MSISESQNSPVNLQLLASQRHLYSQAKRLQRWRVIGTIGLAAIAPLVYYLIPNSRAVLAGIGGVWLLVSRVVLEGIEAKKMKQAATIQEQFDVGLFRLPWNHVLVGNRLSPELIVSADNSFTGDRENLKDWYADTGNVPYPLDALLCQRANLVWDWRLRRHCGLGISILTTLLFGLGVTLAIVTNLTLLDYLLALLMPSLAALLKGVEVARAHFRIAVDKERIEREISVLWEAALKNPTLVSREKCRHIQDCIYVLRSKGPLVPDQWYTWLRDRYQVDMKSAVAELRSRAEQALADSSQVV
jgi:hypothetical protein